MNFLLFAASICVFALLVGMLFPYPEDKVAFLDVGQGDSILVQDGLQQVLIDGGPGAAVLAQLAEELPPLDRTIEVMIATHPDQDHVEGLRHVLDHYVVELVLLPHAAKGSQLFQSFLEVLLERNIPYRFAWAGQHIEVGEAAVHIIAPVDSENMRAATRSGVNNASIAVRIDFHKLSFLLTGDAEQVTEQLLIASTPAQLLDVDILKAGHHGSNTSTHVPLLRAATPAAVVISVGADNRYGHPHPNVLKRLQKIQVWRTDQHGAVRFLHSGRQWLQSCVSC